jgi:hypothetical protein
MWNKLTKIIESRWLECIVLARDLNAMLELADKRGGVGRIERVQKDFQDFVANNDLCKIRPKSGKYTWTNQRASFSGIAKKLDRFFASEDLRQMQVLFESETLPFLASNHFSISIKMIKDCTPPRNLFKFEQMWFREEGFMIWSRSGRSRHYRLKLIKVLSSLRNYSTLKSY